MALTKDGLTLYVIERNDNNTRKSLKQGSSGDFLKIHELQKGGIASSMETLPGFDVQRMQLVGGDR